MKSIEQFINEETQNNEVLDYLKKLYDTYTKKLRSNSTVMADVDRYSYVTHELKKILKILFQNLMQIIQYSMLVWNQIIMQIYMKLNIGH